VEKFAHGVAAIAKRVHHISPSAADQLRALGGEIGAGHDQIHIGWLMESFLAWMSRRVLFLSQVCRLFCWPVVRS